MVTSQLVSCKLSYMPIKHPPNVGSNPSLMVLQFSQVSSSSPYLKLLLVHLFEDDKALKPYVSHGTS
ncbi:hypothetical protein RchiOBHm_Chr7g0180201 [Rosa chinensis]|uniref:Uncharacterized protein n=1 Tax=Rosa chinensis TaxID=74649 RepID=A0A2P6P2A0_ROSCH|nr:hypothetical protein RchiOBHm_Chr7g0180201 [Rosa chinensis]